MNVAETLGERLRTIRGEMGQAEFAARVGSSQSGISAYENGQRRPDYEVLIEICQTFDVNLEWLFMGIGPMYKDSASVSNIDTVETLSSARRRMIAKRVRTARELSKETQKSFAERMETSQSTISALEKGERVLDVEVAVRICEMFNLTPEWLLMGTGPMYKDGLSVPNDRRVGREPEKAIIQHAENIDSEKMKTTDMSVVLELQRELLELTRRCLRDMAEKAALMVRAERDAARIRELERELATLKRDKQEEP